MSMKSSSVALFVTMLLTTVLGATPVSASSVSSARAYAQVKQPPKSPSTAARRALPQQPQQPIASTTSPAPTGRQATTAPRAAAQAVGGSWTSLGPRPITAPAQVNAFIYGNVSGRVTSLAVDPTLPTTVYAGTAGGGVWKTTDSGANWAPTTDGQVSGGIGAIAIDPTNHLIVYAATGEDNACIDICSPSRGVLKTSDGGASWSLIGASTFDTAATGIYFSFGSIAVDSLNNLHVIAATNLGLYDSPDGGTTWIHKPALEAAATRVDPLIPAVGVMQALQDSVLSNRWWAAVSDWCTTEVGDIMVSNDSGVSWTPSRTFSDISGGAERISIAVGGTTTSTVYAEVSGCNSPNIHSGNGPYKYLDGTPGAWTTVSESSATNVMNPPGGGGYALGFWANTIAVDPANAGHVLVGGVSVIASSNSGASWTDVGHVYTGGRIHPDFHAIAFTHTGGIAYAANDGGVWSTSDLGANWTNLNATLQLTQYYAGFAKDLNTFAGGSQDNGTSGRYPGAPAAPALGMINGGDGGWAQFRGGARYYTESQGGELQTVDTSKLATDLNNWTENGPCNYLNPLSPTGPSCNDRQGFPLTPFVASPNTPDNLYVGTYRVWRSGNGGEPAGGANWQAISGDLTVPPPITTPPTAPTDYIAYMAIRSISIAGVVHDVIVTASQAGKVSMSTNAESVTPTWTDITGNLPARTAGNSITFNAFIPAIAINPVDPKEIWVALSSLTLGRVWHTINAGGSSTSWTDLSGTGAGALPLTITKSIAVDPNHPTNVIVGTDSGAFVCLKCGGAAVPSWSQLGTGLPNTRVQFLSVTDDGLNLVAWTHGRGAWATPLVSVGVTTSMLTPTAGVAFDVTVALKQLDGTADTAYRGTIHFTSSDPGSPLLPSDYTFTQPHNGSHTFPLGVTLMTEGSQTVTASDTVPGLVTGTSPTMVVVPTVPRAPGILPAVSGNASATVNWTAPFNGGAPITKYQVTTYSGTTQSSVLIDPTTSYVVNGLTNGTAYTFTVAAVNHVGTGPESSHSNTVVPSTIPGPPTGVSGTPGNGQVALTWTAPPLNGSAITGYRVTPYLGGAAQTAIPTGSTAASYTVAGLTNGTAYTFTVAAASGAGTGPESSATSPVTPFTFAGAPTSATGFAGNATIYLSWTAPSSNGSAISGYRVTPYLGGTAQPAKLTGSPASSYAFTGLANGTYTFTVAAINAAGTGPDSTPSSPVTQVGLESVGGYLTSAPAVTTWSPNRLDAFVRGSDNALYHRSWNGSSWGNWESLGGIVTSDPAAVSSSPNRIDVFVRGTDLGLWHMSWNGSGWSNWDSLGGILTAGPSVTAEGANRLDVVVRGTDNGLWHNWYDGSSWHNWTSVGGLLTAGPAVVSWASGRLDVLVRGTDSALWHTFMDSSGWHSWDRLGGYMTTGPTAASCASGQLRVFTLGTDNGLWQLSLSGGAWGNWQSLGGQWTSAPAAICEPGTAVIDIFVRGTDGGLWHNRVNAS
jgi:Fibronectin type III domain/Repeat of unknown function (DUF346)